MQISGRSNFTVQSVQCLLCALLCLGANGCSKQAETASPHPESQSRESAVLESQSPVAKPRRKPPVSTLAEKEASIYAARELASNGARLSSSGEFTSDGLMEYSSHGISFREKSKSHIEQQIPLLLKLTPVAGTHRGAIYLKPNLFNDREFRAKLEDNLPGFQILSESSEEFKAVFPTDPRPDN